MIDGLSSSNSSDSKPSENHPTDAELYDYFTIRGHQLDHDKRQAIALHVALCTECATTGKCAEQIEEYMSDVLASPETEQDRAALKRSLVVARSITQSPNRSEMPAPSHRQFKRLIPVFLRDLFAPRWRPRLNTIELTTASLLACVGIGLLGYGGWYLINRKAESVAKKTVNQAPNTLLPTPSPAVAQASPKASGIPSPRPHTKELEVKSTDSERPLSDRGELLAHLDSHIHLGGLAESADRGGGSQAKISPTIPALTTRMTKIRIQLPEGSASGSYLVSIEDAYFHPVAPSAKAQSPNGKALVVWLDLRSLPEDTYYLGIAREDSAPEHYQIRLLAVKPTSSQAEQGTRPIKKELLSR